MNNHLMTTYAPLNIQPVRGEGVWLECKSGRRYLDMGAGVAVNSFGHCFPPLVKSLQDQAQKLWHASNLYDLPLSHELADKLCAHSFADRVFFTNSGLESMEACIKMARRYHYNKGNSQKWRIITFEGAFHGRSIATIAAGNQSKHLEGFGPKADGFDQVMAGNIEALKAAINDETAAIMIEPIQGESGIKHHPSGFLKTLRHICDENNLLLIFDEVQCGIGRTGSLFCYEHEQVTPDIMGLAKGLGGGFPIGAVLSHNEVASAMTPGSHGSTFGGNPLATTIGMTILDLLLQKGFLDDVVMKGNDLCHQLQKLSLQYPHIIKEIRGTGLMIGMVCHIDHMALYHKLAHAGLLLIPAGDNTLRWLPALNVTKEEYEQALAILAETCQQWDGEK